MFVVLFFIGFIFLFLTLGGPSCISVGSHESFIDLPMAYVIIRSFSLLFDIYIYLYFSLFAIKL